MKIFLAFVYLFGSIFIIFGMLWLLIWVAPAEYMLNRGVLLNRNGMLDSSDQIFPSFPLKETFTFPGSIAGLTARNEIAQPGATLHFYQ